MLGNVYWLTALKSITNSTYDHRDVVICRSPEWNTIMKSDREKIGLTFTDDGEFWSAILTVSRTLHIMFLYSDLPSASRPVNKLSYIVHTTMKVTLGLSTRPKETSERGRLFDSRTFYCQVA